MQYRRAYVPGGCYFFTVVTQDRQQIFTDENTVALLRESFRHVMQKYPFELDAMVVLPDHLHCMWKMSGQDADFSTRWRLIKRYFNKIYQQPAWQKRFWEHLIRDATDYAHHLDYIHYNSVKHGYVKTPEQWPFSSFKKFRAMGVYGDDWGEKIPDIPDSVGYE